MNRMDEATIDECVAKTKELLNEHWTEIKTVRQDNPNEKMKINFDFNLSYRNEEQLIRTKITFGMRKTDHRDSVVNPNQMDLPMEGNGADLGAPTDQPVPTHAGRKKRGRTANVGAGLEP